jgi:glycosyltransferase involved in cell wall biosynthesis
MHMHQNNTQLKTENIPSENEGRSGKLVSIVIPCYNEEKNVERYATELLPVLDRLPHDYEVIAVEDGSTKDDTWGALTRLSKNNTKFKAVRHSRNYGMGAAYQTAFDMSRGDYVVLYSADLEIPAEAILDVIKKLDEGYDVVNTNRKGRWKENGVSALIRRVPSNIANWLIQKISGVKVLDTGSGLKGFRRFVIKNLNIYGDMHRFLPAYSSLYTQKITEFDVEYKERTYGAPAYGSLKRTFSVFLDLFSMKFMLSFATKPFSMMPGRIFGTAGLLSFFFGSVGTAYLIFVKIAFGQSIGDRPLFTGSLILVIFGVQLIMTGLLGELLLRIYFEGSNRKPYIVAEQTD